MSVGENGNVNNQDKSKKDEEKKCLVKFRPCNEWQGEYGFDWVREDSDYPKVVYEGQLAENYIENIGKYFTADFCVFYKGRFKNHYYSVPGLKVKNFDGELTDELGVLLMPNIIDNANFSTDALLSQERCFPFCQWHFCDSMGQEHLLVKEGDEFYEPYYKENVNDSKIVVFVKEKEKHNKKKDSEGKKKKAKKKIIRKEYILSYKAGDLNAIFIWDLNDKRTLTRFIKSGNSWYEDVLRGTSDIITSDLYYYDGSSDYFLRLMKSMENVTPNRIKRPLEHSLNHKKNRKLRKKYGITQEMLNNVGMDYDTLTSDAYNDVIIQWFHPEFDKYYLCGVKEKIISKDGFNHTKYTHFGVELHSFVQEYMDENYNRFSNELAVQDEVGCRIPCLSLCPKMTDGFFRRQYNDKAKVELRIKGDYKKLVFKSPKGVSVGPDISAGKDKAEIEIELDRYYKGDGGYITVYDKNKIFGDVSNLPEVGRLRLKVFQPIDIKVVYVNVFFMTSFEKNRAMISLQRKKQNTDDENIMKMLFKESGKAWSYSGDSGSNSEWNRKQMSKEADILRQAGIYIEKEEEVSTIMDFSLIQSYDIIESGPYRYVVRKERRDSDNKLLGTVIDEEFLRQPKNMKYQNHIRIYLKDYGFLDFEVRQDDQGQMKEVPTFYTFGYSTGYDKHSCILIFKRSISINGAKASNTLGHEIMHRLGLDHTFHNRNPYTFKYATTGNVMDYSMSNNNSTNQYQWKLMREGANKQ